MSASNLHIAWARLFMSALASAGVEDVVLSPGSRVAPLALAAASEPGLRLHVITDERSAAFFALGQARITGRPSALVCTSGTAGAHYYPAIIEAAQSFVPLVVITADRPWELCDVAAPQTIDQAKLFGGYARHYAELGLPDTSAFQAVSRIALQAVSRALHPLPGPTHINGRFRKPLEPSAIDAQEAFEPELARIRDRGPSRVIHGSCGADERLALEIAERCARSERGLIVCGPAIGASETDLRRGVLALARATGFPLLPEATSRLRFGGAQPGVTICSGFDAVLRSDAFSRAHVADLVIQIGAPPTSTAYARYLGNCASCDRIVVASHGWNDPTGDATLLAIADPGPLLLAAAAHVDSRERPRAFARAFAEADARVQSIVESEVSGEKITEAAIARAVVASCSEGSVLIAGNSGPVRDLDTWAPATARPLCVLHQRGASGIDGLVSGAAGASSVVNAPVTLLLGDVSLLHDLGGLELLRRAKQPLTVVIVNNDGGRIFEQLPIAHSVDAGLLDRCFTTPHGLSFEAFARGFGIEYAAPRTRTELAQELVRARDRRGATLVEAKVDPHEGALRMERLRERVGQELSR